MAQTRASREPAGRRTYAAIAAAIAIAVVVARVGESRADWLQTAVLIFGSLLIQSLPFVVVGALASALIEVFVPVSSMARLARLPRPLQLPAAALAGVAFPICECGSVPVARGLVHKGLRPAAAVAFMLAAPVVNPVVMISTFVAFRTQDNVWTMVGGRFALGILVACVVGWVAGAGASAKDFLRTPAGATELPVMVEAPVAPRWQRLFEHFASDLLFMGRYLVLGASLAALVQTFVPAPWIASVAGLPVVSILAMMLLAAMLSLCSESDAFVAASFVGFGASAQLAFLVFGPMVDVKLAVLYRGTFRTGFTRTVIVAAAATTLVATLWLQPVIG